jgi:hypothetical protein
MGAALYQLGAVASTLPYWYDELLTVRLASLSSVAELWSALTAGFDFNPPLNYVLTSIARTVLADADPLSARLPALAGLALLMTGLFAALERRVGSWFALAAVAPVLLTSLAIGHSTDARPYMPLAGVAAWAVYFRDRATTGTARWAASLVGLAVTVAAALLLHVWGVLLLMALFAGEMAFAARHRRVRTGTIVALTAATPVLILYLPLIAGARGLVFDNDVYAPTLAKLAQVFLDILPPLRFAATIVGTAVAAGIWRNRSRRTSGDVGLTADETVVAVLLLVSPLVPYVYAVATEGVFMSRYGALAIVGGVTLAAPVLRRLARGDERAGVLAAGVAVISVLLYLPSRLDRNLPSEPTAVRSLESAASGLDPAIPILLVNPTDVLPFDERAADTWRRRSYYAADGDMAVRYTGTNAIDVGYVRGAPYLKLRMNRLATEDLDRMPRVYLLGRQQALSWVPQHLEAGGWTMTLVGGLPSCPIYLATRPDVATPMPR